jgi:hypothetical protein
VRGFPDRFTGQHLFVPAELRGGLLQLHVEYAAADGPFLASPTDHAAAAPSLSAVELKTPVAKRAGEPLRRHGGPVHPGSPRPASEGSPGGGGGLAIPATPGSDGRGVSPMRTVRDGPMQRPSPRPSPSWSPSSTRSWGSADKHAASSLVGSYEVHVREAGVAVRCVGVRGVARCVYGEGLLMGPVHARAAQESLLTGRMSALPARTIEFTAELGAYGQGACRPALKCPAHVHLPCPATFYQLPQEQPSPYVGVVTFPPDAATGDRGHYPLPPRGIVQLVRVPRVHAQGRRGDAPFLATNVAGWVGGCRRRLCATRAKRWSKSLSCRTT